MVPSRPGLLVVAVGGGLLVDEVQDQMFAQSPTVPSLAVPPEEKRRSVEH